MAQPAGQVLLDAAHPYYGYLYYAHDTGGGGANDAGMWDARNGAMLAKSGSGTVITEGGAKLFNSPGGASASVLSLPVALALSGAYTIIVRLRKNAGASDSAGIFFGAPGTGGSYMWFRTSEIRHGSSVLKTNTNVGDLATYMFVRSADGLTRYTYKDNDAGNTVSGFIAGLTIDRLMAGLSPDSTYAANGAMEMFRIIPGLLPTPEQRTELFADPYIGLVAAADTTAPALSAASVGASGSTDAIGGVTTDEAGPAWAVLTTSSTTPTDAQIKAGQDQAGAAAAAADTATLVAGSNASAFVFSGLTSGATYYLHVTQDDTATPANTATPITSPSVTMPAPDVTLPVLTGSITLVGKTQTTISVACPAGSDNVAVTAYEWSSDGGSTWADDDTTKDFTGLTASTAYAIRVRARDAAGNVSTPALALSVTTDAPPSGTITITSPVPYRLQQRDVLANTGAITIAGTSTATTAIEYRRGTGSWQTLVASHPGGAYSATVTMPTGQGNLQVRHASDNSVTANVALATVGDKFILGGQSNNVGSANEAVPPVASAFTALEYDRADTWKPLQEGITQATSFDGGSSGSKGSYVGALSNRLQANGVPVAFIPAAAGSTQIISWTPAAGSLYNNMLAQWNQAGGGRGLILWQGESDATGGTTKADYKSRMHAVIDGWWADTGTPTFVVLITNFHVNAPLIREAQMEVIAENPHVIGWADGGGAYSGDVHYLTSAQINAVADAIYTPFAEAFYSSTTALDAGSDSVAAVDAGGSALFAYALGAGSDSVATVDAGAGIGSGLALDGGADASATSDAGGSALFAYLLSAGADAVYSADAGSGVAAEVPDVGSWPAGPIGSSHTLVVPSFGGRDQRFRPEMYGGDRDIYAVNFVPECLAPMNDSANTLLACMSTSGGITVSSRLPAGSAIHDGIVELAVLVPEGAPEGAHNIVVHISTMAGRELTAVFTLQVLETP